MADPASGPLSLDDVKAAVAALSREDRTNLRPWLLARFDVRGYEIPLPNQVVKRR